MFLHQFKYTVKRLLHTPADIIWVLLFPIILGTLFYVAFSNIKNTSENFHAIPVAIVLNDTPFSDNFGKTVDVLGEEGEDQLLSIIYTDADHAKNLLEDKKISGILTADTSVSLTITNSSGTLRLEQSILESFIKQYNIQTKAIESIAATHPEKLKDVLLSLTNGTSYLTEKKLTSGNMDNIVQYFFNLIAMSCLYTSFTGCGICIKNQANLSAIGARKMVSGNRRAISLISEFFANLVVQFSALCLVLFYLIAILKVDFGSQIGLTLLSIFVSCMLGISMGMFVGSLGHLSEGLKSGFLVGISMLFCFLSGLMLDNVRPLIEKFCPLLNKINPAVRISDCFYSLSVYDTYERFASNVIAILIFTALFLTGTLFLTRRDTYASL